MSLLITVLLIIIVLWLVAATFMRGENPDEFDRDDDAGAGRSFSSGNGPSQEHVKIGESIREFVEKAAQLSKKQQLDSMRRFMEDMFEGRKYVSDFVPVDAEGVAAEWVLAPGTDPSKRVLYIHGGAEMSGWSRSHRNISNRVS